MNDDGGRCELPSPVLPGELSHLTQEPELQEAWGHCAAMRRAEAAAIEALHAYRVRRLAEASGEHAFRRRAVEKAVPNEAGAVLGLTSSEVRRYLDCADFVQDKLPQTWRAFRSGATDIKRVRRIAQAAEGIAHRRDLMPVFDAEAAEKASAMNIHEIDRWAKRRVPELDAEAHRTRCERARQNRFVAFTHRDDGMTKIDALLPTVSVVAVERQLQQEALRAVRRGGGSPSSRTDSDTPHDEQKLTLVQAMADAFAARVAGIPEPSASGAGAANSASARGRVTEPAHPGASENQGADQLPLESSEAPEPADTAAPQPPISARIGILVPAETLTGEGETPAVSEDGSFVLPAPKHGGSRTTLPPSMSGTPRAPRTVPTASRPLLPWSP
ncbi:DUF222 domain-containing protein [Nesterenkonia sp.]|uniref:DUF222 domain-containing protein n=1 Tax=Nesterenkonia sp. TaxID=704201 RepID=UPI0026380421|nr:DUF222 domain-containing protein [Nesterenkonia sp.]